MTTNVAAPSGSATLRPQICSHCISFVLCRWSVTVVHFVHPTQVNRLSQLQNSGRRVLSASCVLWCRLSGIANATERNVSREAAGFSNWSINVTWPFATMFFIAHLLTISWDRRIHSSLSHPTPLRSIFKLSSHLRLGLPNCLFLSCLPANTLYAFLFFPNVLHDMIWYDIFIYCNWVSSRWQWRVNLDKKRKETAIYKRRNNTQNNKKAQNRNRKQT